MPLEAQACGTPVIAFGEGGATETVRGLGHSQPTGTFFYSQTPAALQAAVLEFEKMDVQSADCRLNAEGFSNQRFRKQSLDMITAAWEDFSL